MLTETDKCASIYPVHLLVRGRDVWMAWRSSEEPTAALLKKSGVVLHAQTKAELMAQCRSVQADVCFEEHTQFDLNSLLVRLVARAPVSAVELINCWNMLIDVRHGLDPVHAVSYDFTGGSLLQTYDRFFSSTSSADMMGFGFKEVEDGDVKNAAGVISTGMLMVLGLVEGRAKAHG